jgi:hypothetical protein
VRFRDQFFQRLAGIVVFLAAAALAPAQTTATISGYVEDAAGSRITGATVTVKSLETGATRSVTTDATGHYIFVALPIGRQQVDAEKQGFKESVRTGIKLEVGQHAIINLRLEVGEVAQQITVSEQVPLVNTTTSSISGLVGEQQVKDLPLNGRSLDQLITLNPGSINYTPMTSPGTITSTGNTFSVSGRRTAENLFLLNGIEYTGSSQLSITPGGVSGELLGVDAIREFNVLTDTYSAEYGKRAGAQVSIVTQSGTNQVHGAAFEFLRNSALDARNFFDRNFVPPFRRNQFGGALGGPIKKNKIFLFGNYEGFRQSLALSNVSVVPDDQARKGLLPNSSGVYEPVPNLDPAMLPYLSLWPVANGPVLGGGAALNYSNPKQPIREDFGTLRADFTISEADSLSAAYTIDNGDSQIPQADPLFGALMRLQSQVASLQETHVFTPWMLNTARIGFSRAAFNFDPLYFASFPAGTSFVAGAGPGGITIGGGLTTTGAGALTPAGPNNAANSWNRRNLYTYSDDVSVNRGRHQISAGVWFQPMQDNEDSASRQLGQASFTSLETLLQGTVSSFQVVPNPTEIGFRSKFGAWYAQDAIRVRPNLTVQLGVRDEFTTGWNAVDGRASNFITNANGVLLTQPMVGSSVFTQNNATHLFSPRASVAWDPFGDGKTSIRAGFGIYYTLLDSLSFLLNSLPPFNTNISFANVPLSSFTPIVPSIPQPPACGAAVGKPCTTYAPQGVQPNAQTPTVDEWNFTVERQLDSNTVLRAAYIGSHGYHNLLSIDPNTIAPQVCASASGCLAGGTGSLRSTVPQGMQYIPVGSRPNPYLSAGFFWYTEANSSYNALQLDVDHRLTRGLQFRANYTWSKNLDINSGLTGAQANNQPQMVMVPSDPGRDWGPSALTPAQQATVSMHYDLPFGAGQRWLHGGGRLLNKLTEGWQLNAIYTALSGFPFTPTAGSNRSGDGDVRNPDRPNLNPSFSGPVVPGSPHQWFNPNAFVLPAPGTYGDLGRGVFTGPGLSNLDFGLMKDTAISERVNLQFRAEFFNLFNQTNFGPPNPIVFSAGKINSSAGLITRTATTSREVQFGLKLMF